MDNPIDGYNKLRKLRDAFKKVMQLSYNLSQMDHKFPLDSLEKESYPNMLQVYKDFYYELEKAKQDILVVLEELNGQ